MRNRGSILSAVTLVVAVGLIGSDAHADYRDLCGSVPSACEYTGPDAPVLAADVCWDRSTSSAKLMTGACPTGSWPYFVKYGVVDPLSLVVTAFQPLDDTCSRPGLCQPAILAPSTTTAGVICCFGDVCYPSDGDCYGGELSFCLDGVTNEDDTVTCFEQG